MTPPATEPARHVATGPRAPAEDPGSGRRAWRPYLGLTLLVVWAALGLVFSLGAVAFLALGPGLVLLGQLCRRGPMRELLVVDRRGIAGARAGKAAVVASLLLVPLFLFLRYLPTWVDNSWIVLLAVLGLAAAYVVLRRVVIAVAVTAILVAGATWIQTPHLAAARTGDPALLAQLGARQSMGSLAGYHELAVAEVDLAAAQPVRLAGLGAGARTRMEVGSITKALTGLVIADSVERGELRLDAPVDTYLPQLRGSPAGTATIRELVTHRSGYAQFGATTLRRAAWSAPIGRNWIDTSLEQTMGEARNGDLAGRGEFQYSTLGAAAAGQAAAAAAGMSYPELMRTRLFGPLGMTDTAIQVGHPLVRNGRTVSGLSVQPWVFDGYAPGGAAVSTAQDLGILATALLNGTAPGMEALTATAATDQGNTSIGAFWRVSTWQTGQTITWHNGQTAGYTSYLGLDRVHRTAVVVLSDVAVDPGTTDLGIQLLAARK